MPPPLENRPKLDEASALYYEVFIDLSTSRATGETLSPIPFSEVMKYCDELGVLDRDLRFTYWRIIHACDGTVLSDHVTAMKAEAERLRNKKV